MSAIYIHIPFCKQACNYCNFHFSASRKKKPEFLQALKNEIVLQKDFFNDGINSKAIIDTLYLGGGTPSILDIGEINSIFEEITKYYILSPSAEITLEANPDDLTLQKLQELRQTPVNRLSIGVQSFHAPDLTYMNRAHNPQHAMQALENSKKAGFENITVDLIYGTPGLSDKQWLTNIETLIDLDIRHISAYSLTVEPKTPLDLFIRKGKNKPIDDGQAAQQFEILCNVLSRHGYDHYEISNFGRPGYYSRHNMVYWSGKPYLGLGPSAHSFMPGKRRWNVANTSQYIAQLAKNQIPYEEEILTPVQQHNEYVMTSLRTMWGIDKMVIKQKFGAEALSNLLISAQKHLIRNNLKESKSHIIITQQGKFYCDGIASDLFMD